MNDYANNLYLIHICLKLSNRSYTDIFINLKFTPVISGEAHESTLCKSNLLVYSRFIIISQVVYLVGWCLCEIITIIWGTMGKFHSVSVKLSAFYKEQVSVL